MAAFLVNLDKCRNAWYIEFILILKESVLLGRYLSKALCPNILSRRDIEACRTHRPSSRSGYCIPLEHGVLNKVYNFISRDIFLSKRL